MGVHALGWHTTADDFREKALEQTGISYIFKPPTKRQDLPPLAVVFIERRVIIFAQRRSHNGSIQYLQLSIRTSDFWKLYDGTYQQAGRKLYEQIGTYPEAVQRLFAFTWLPVSFFDDPLPPGGFLDVSSLKRLAELILGGFLH